MEEAKTQILWGLEQADVVKISDEEVEFLWRCNEKEGADKLLNEFGIKLVMVTSGSKGAFMQNRNGFAFSSYPPVNPIDTTGGEDIFGGSALSRILKIGKAPDELESEDLAEVVSFAVTAASLSTQKQGRIPSIPDEREVYAMML